MWIRYRIRCFSNLFAKMFASKDIKQLLKKLRSSNRHSQLRILKEIVKFINLMTSRDVLLLMEYLDNIDDIDLEVRIISILAFIITSQRCHYETIATYAPLYGKIESMLRRGLPLKTAHVLQFLSALLFADGSGGGGDGGGAGGARRLASLARSEARVSGCLRTMAAMFVEGMMFPDTWKALCQCLAECCYISPVNKDYCSHLIPTCIQKCIQGLTDVIEVLQSLLSNNNKNIEKFVMSNGIQIFSRESLHYESCLQLLCTVVQNAEAVSIITQQTQAKEYVMDILKWNGPYSQKGQWCTIILYYLESRDKSKLIISQQHITEPALKRAASQPAPSEIQASDVDDAVGSATKDNTPEQAEATGNPYNDRNYKDTDETMLLLRNVVKELLYWNPKGQTTSRMNPSVNAPVQHNINISGYQKASSCENIPVRRQAKLREDNNDKKFHDKDLTFSFLRENRTTDEFEETCTHDARNRSPQFTKVGTTTKQLTEKSVQTNVEYSSYRTILDDKDSSINTHTFEPAVASTPKRLYKTSIAMDASIDTRRSNKNLYDVARANYKSNEQKLKGRQLRKLAKAKKVRSPKVQKVSNRSMSSRFLSAINESCTTFVKTVKDVFTPWKNVSTLKTKDSLQKVCDTRDVNFMAYMRKREAMFGEVSGGARADEMCHTCDDTRMMKQKMEQNECLRKTVKKLKLGINLFGCDFKKISKTFWPQETHMSPTVLYNLYRKLIVK